MEYMEYGCLHDHIISRPMDYPLLVKIAKDIANGMQFLHDKRILHRDFNSKNILLTAGPIAKVADFGLSRKKLDDTTLSYTMGQVPWMAPEVLQLSKNYTTKSDVYSFGILLWEMVARKSPCPPELSYISMANKVVKEQWRPDVPDGVSSDWKKLTEASWSQSENLRPTFTEIHKILSEFNVSPCTEVVLTTAPSSVSREGTYDEDVLMMDINDLSKKYDGEFA